MSAENGDRPVAGVDLARDRATRYARALAAAAGAEERVKALEEALSQSEYHRDVAECQLSAVEYDGLAGRVYTAADGEEPDCDAVLDLHSGDVWWRRKDRTGWAKRHGASTMSTSYEWPPETAGPFIAFSETWNLARLHDEAEEAGREAELLRRRLRGEPGYRAEGDSSWATPPLDEALGRVLAAKDRLVSAAKSAQGTAELKAAELATRLEEAEKLLGERVPDTVQKFRDQVFGQADGASPHQLVKRAEHEILQDVDVPEDGGDPSYSKDRLLKAATMLVAAAHAMEKEEKAEAEAC